MKLHTKINLKRIAVAFGLVLIIPASSCKKMDDELINSDTKQLPYGPYVAGGYLTSMMQHIINATQPWLQQTQQNLNADHYSGYMASANPFGGRNNNTYFMRDSWNNDCASTPYDFVLNPFLEVQKMTKDSEKELYAIALILKVSAGHRLADIFGPVPYTQMGTSTAPAFDSQETLYKAFFSELKTAIDILTAAEDKDAQFDQSKFAAFDKSNLGGDFKLWVKYANTLRLRLAMRVVYVNEALAMEQAKAATDHKFGFLEQPFSVDCGSTNHYLWTLSQSWGDISFNADMEVYLNGFKDPRAPKIALPATAPAAVAGKIKGIRSGVDITGKIYTGYSKINYAQSDKQVILMSGSESFFLRAEILARGWTFLTGSAQTFYEQGITKSFDYYGVSGVTNYLNDATSTPTAYTDVVDPTNDLPSPSTVTVQWVEGASLETKLEKIITQKWIAGFPEGQEAWTEFRRTGYPKLFPNKDNYSNGEVAPGQFIKRLNYPSYFTLSNPGGVAAAGISNQMGTRLWWDKK